MKYAVTIRENRQYVVIVEAPDPDTALGKAFDKYHTDNLTPESWDADPEDAEYEIIEEDCDEC